jgi:RNA polymerase sigma factor (sigma-70 family)
LSIDLPCLFSPRLSTYTPLRLPDMTDDTSIGGTRQQFPSTHWSLIEGTRSTHAEERQRALETLISAYWKPVYKYIRLHWKKDNEPAKDLTQEFFARLVEKRLLDRFDPDRARLRTYLRVCVDGLVMNEDKAAQRVKRGGDIALLPLDFESVEGEMTQVQVAAPDNPEELFSREFARSLFGLALERLRRECQERGKTLHYELLELYDIEEGGKQLTYDEVARRFNIKPTDVTNYLAYARKEFRRVVLAELRAMTATEDEFRREAQTLLGVKP